MANLTSLPEPVFPHPIRTEWKMLALFKRDNPASTIGDCAKALGVNYHTIRAWIRQPLYQSYENWFLKRSDEDMPLAGRITKAEMQETLDDFAVEMQSRLQSIVETSNDDKLLSQIAFDALDRAGYAAERRDAKRPIQLILTPEVLRTFAERGREIANADIIVGEVISKD